MPVDENTVVAIMRIDSTCPTRPMINVEYVPLDDGSKNSYVSVKFGNYVYGSIRVPGHVFEVKIEVSGLHPIFQGVSNGEKQTTD